MIKPLGPSQTDGFFVAQREVWQDEKNWCEISVSTKTNLGWHKGTLSYNESQILKAVVGVGEGRGGGSCQKPPPSVKQLPA